MKPRKTIRHLGTSLVRQRVARLLLTALFTSSLGLSPAAQALPNGGSVLGAISVSGESDSYTFSASVGHTYVLHAADLDLGSFSPRLDVYAPDGALITSASASEVASIIRGVYLSGTHTVVVSDGNPNPVETGSYELFFVRAPGANEGGALPNGGSVSGSISLGDLDSFTFTGEAGERVELRVADMSQNGFSPRMVLYGPNGSQVSFGSSSSVAYTLYKLSETGTHLVLLSDGNSEPNQTGTYDLHFVHAPGANEEGPLVNGGNVTGFISRGDLDTWTFDARAGEGVVLSVVDRDNKAFDPSLRLYSPHGEYLDGASGTRVATISRSLAESGTFIVLVSDGSPGRNRTGAYDLHFVNPPGANEEGPLVNGGSVTGTIDLGDLDTWTFDADANEGIELSIANSGPSGFAPRLVLYSPQGVELTASSAFFEVAAIRRAVPDSGTYTVLVADSRNNTTPKGPYTLHFVHAPGANEGGVLPNGGSVAGTIDRGDLDSFTFDASVGETFELRVADTGATALLPRLALYAPNGGKLAEVSDDEVAAINLIAQEAGTYVVALSDGNLLPSATGTYQLHFGLAPGADEGGLLVDGVQKFGAIDLGDLDSFTFLATAGQRATVTLTRTAGTLNPRLVLYDVSGSKLRSTTGSTSASFTGTLPVDGLYTFFVSDGGAQITKTGTYSIVIDGSGNTPAQYPNTSSPAELSTDPVLADVAGALTLGPRIGDPLEPFNVSLDCTGASSTSLYLMEVRLGQLVTPALSTWGWIWVTGAPLGSKSGPHGQGVVRWITSQPGITLPPDPSLLGVSYTVQGFCGGYVPHGRMSNALTQTIGG